FYPLGDEPNGFQAFADGDEGALLIGTHSGVKQLVNDKIEPYPLPGTAQLLDIRTLLRDRDGGLWIGTRDQGIVHVHHGKIDGFSRSLGLSGDSFLCMFEDREGNIWTSTVSGLDRFRDFAVATYSVDQGLPNADVFSVLATRDGSVWLSTRVALSRWNGGRISIPPTGSAKRDGKLNGDLPNSLFQDGRGRIWISTRHGFGYLENDRFNPVNTVPGGPVHSMAQDNGGNLWIAN